MESATWCRTPAAASAAKRLRPEVSKNSSTALSSNDGELARSITTCAPATASLRPSPVMVLTPLLGEAATTSWPPWRRMATVFEPIRPVPPITTIFTIYPPLSMTGDPQMGSASLLCGAVPIDNRVRRVTIGPQCSLRSPGRDAGGALPGPRLPGGSAEEGGEHGIQALAAGGGRDE